MVSLSRLYNSASLKRMLPILAAFTIVFGFLALFVWRYVSHEKFIYFWDWAGYQDLYIELGERFRQRPFKTFGAILTSIRKRDYNLLFALFLMPIRPFGTSRHSYIMAVTLLFAFPAIVSFVLLMRKLRGTDEPNNQFDRFGLSLIALVVLGLSPQLWGPVLLGYPDVVGVVVIYLILWLHFRTDFTMQSSRSLWSLGLLLSFLVMLRRWYAYWVVGFFAAVILTEGWKWLREKGSRQQLEELTRKITKVVLISAGSFFVIATPIAWKMLTTDYRAIYSAYQQGEHFHALYNHFGMLMMGLVVFGIIGSLRRERRRMAVFLCLQFAVTFVLFTRVQSIDHHHYNWVLATLAIFATLCLQDVLPLIRSAPAKAAYIALVVAISFANFLIVLAPGVEARLQPVAFALPKTRLYPKTRPDMDQVHLLLNALDSITRPQNSDIYVLASSINLNSVILYEACHLFDPPLPDLQRRLLPVSNVDKRDGFPFQFLKAQYVVVADPIAYHLAPTDQRVIGILADQLLRGEGIGKAYDRLGYEFSLQGGTAYIYRKSRAFDPSDLTALSDRFLHFYPDYRKQFEISPELVREVSSP